MPRPRSPGFIAAGFIICCLAAACVLCAGSAHALIKMTPADVAARISRSWQCTNYMIVGFCWCGLSPCAFLVAQYVPTSFIETTRAPGETMVTALDFSQLTAGAAGLAIGGDTRQINQSGMDNTYEAHVFTLPDRIVQLSNACLTCKPSSAQLAATPSPYPRGLGDALCGSVTPIVTRLSNFFDVGGLGGYSLSLRYSSEADALQWRTGCRDMNLVDLLRSNGWTCSAEGAAQLAGSAEPLARLLGADACIGTWGPNFPRQMRTRGPDEVRSSAIAAYRAMSIARTDLGTFPYPVDTLGKLQQAYPGVSQCVRIGASPVLPSDMRRSPDGAYGWIYWRPTLCCVPFDISSNC
jgi:hypothetical protein